MKNKTPLLAGIVVLVGIVIVLLMNLGSAIKPVIEKIASSTLGVEVDIKNLDISIKEKSVSITGVKVANPKGFKQPNLLTISNILVSAGQLTGDKITLNQVAVTGMEVTYELGAKGSNLNQIKSNLKKPSATTSSSSQENDPASQTAFIIKKINIKDTKIIPSLGKASNPILLPSLSIQNIGTASKPASAREAMTRVFQQIMSATIRTVTKSGITNTAKDLVGGGVKNAGDKLKGLLGR